MASTSPPSSQAFVPSILLANYTATDVPLFFSGPAIPLLPAYEIPSSVETPHQPTSIASFGDGVIEVYHNSFMCGSVQHFSFEEVRLKDMLVQGTLKPNHHLSGLGNEHRAQADPGTSHFKSHSGPGPGRSDAKGSQSRENNKSTRSQSGSNASNSVQTPQVPAQHAPSTPPSSSVVASPQAETAKPPTLLFHVLHSQDGETTIIKSVRSLAQANAEAFSLICAKHTSVIGTYGIKDLKSPDALTGTEGNGVWWLLDDEERIRIFVGAPNFEADVYVLNSVLE